MTTLQQYKITIPKGTGDVVSAIFAARYFNTPSAFCEEMLVAVHKALREKFALELYSHNNLVNFALHCDQNLSNYLNAVVYSLQPMAELDACEPILSFGQNDFTVAGAEIGLMRSEIFPFKTYPATMADPLHPLLNELATIPPDLLVAFQLVVQRISDNFRLQALLFIKRLIDQLASKIRIKNWVKQEVRKLQLEHLRKKAGWQYFKASIRLAVIDPTGTSSARALKEQLETALRGLSMFTIDDVNGLRARRYYKQPSFLNRFTTLQFYKPYKLGIQEVATLWHFPGPDSAPHLAAVTRKRLPPPIFSEVVQKDATLVGISNFRNCTLPIFLNRADRAEHMHISGQQGSGKSSLIYSLIYQDIIDGFGCGIIDPDGALSENILKVIPEKRVSDVVIFDPTDVEYPPSFNPLENVSERYRLRVMSNIMDAFSSRFSSIWNEKVEFILRQAVLATLSTKWTTVASIYRMLGDNRYRNEIVAATLDYLVSYFWKNEFGSVYSSDDVQEAITLISREIETLIGISHLKHILVHPHNKFDFDDILNAGRILVVRLPQAVLGQKDTALLGSMLLTRIFQAAMARGELAPNQRRAFYLYIDNYEELLYQSLDEILSESRKYRLNLTLSSGAFLRLPATTRQAVTGNVSSLLTFALSTDDAEILCSEFGPDITSEDISNLMPGEFYARTIVNGVATETFSGEILPLNVHESGMFDKCREYSRERYCDSAEIARQIVEKWSEIG
ncbi:MAG: hypothetical protein D6719_05010 [Candidatus Dadabacteria bacterium]|nr:MAG: hypothetical protein D6719_05010 [Candidatus Dadabacteria bacterium]